MSIREDSKGRPSRKAGTAMKLRMLLALLAVLAPMILAGCASAPEMWRVSYPAGALTVGDEIAVKFTPQNELDETLKVRRDGMVSLQMIGDLYVTGLTPDDLVAKLLDLYAEYLVDPEISVMLQTPAQRYVYVSGQVNNPGAIELQGKLSALEAILRAGDFNRATAQVKDVMIIRHVNGDRYTRIVNLKKALKNSKTEPFMLLPNDIVHVPMTRGSKVAQFVAGSIDALIPDFVTDAADVYASSSP